nr:hypothetical protein [Tanacetum cinerariifolium]
MFPQLNLGLDVPSFLPSDDPIASLNKAMAFISTVFASRYPPTNNQLRTSSNPRNQATIQDGRAHESRVILDEEQLAFLADPGDRVDLGPNTQTLPTTATFQTEDLDAFNSDCDEAPSASAVLMAKLSAYESYVLSEKYDPLSVIDSEETLDLAEVTRTWGFEHIRKAFKKDVIPFVKSLRESFTTFDQGLFKEINKMEVVLNQMETEVEQCFVDRKCVEIKKKELLTENDYLLEQIIFHDIMCSVMHANVENKCVLPTNDETIKYVEMEQSYINEYNRRLEFEAELLKKKDMLKKLFIMNFQTDVQDLKNVIFLLKYKAKSGKSKKNEWKPTGKLKPKADIGIFIAYSPAKKAYRIYNKLTRLIMETIHVEFDELMAMASEQFGSGPKLQLMTPGIISSRLVQNVSSPTPYVSPTKKDWDILFQPMFDEYFHPSPSALFRVLLDVASIPVDTIVKPKNYKEALKESCWIDAIQEEIHEFERLQVWELVPRPD